jgi:hypothetical protein
MTIDAWTQRHGIVDDAGRPLYLRLSQLRKTHKALWYLKTEGHMARFAVGHTVEIAARHYADIPVAQTAARADRGRCPRSGAAGPGHFLPPDEERLRGELASPTPDDEGVRAHCSTANRTSGLPAAATSIPVPLHPPVPPCPTPFWGCLDCRNAVITARKLPAILAFLSFVDDQRAGLSAGRLGRQVRPCP